MDYVPLRVNLGSYHYEEGSKVEDYTLSFFPQTKTSAETVCAEYYCDQDEDGDDGGICAIIGSYRDAILYADLDPRPPLAEAAVRVSKIFVIESRRSKYGRWKRGEETYPAKNGYAFYGDMWAKEVAEFSAHNLEALYRSHGFETAQARVVEVVD